MEKVAMYEELIYKEASLLSKPDRYYKYDDFLNGKKNVLLVSGYSGGGKSTLARQLANETGAKFIEFDDLKKLIDTNPDAPVMKSFLEKNPGYKNKINSVTAPMYQEEYFNHVMDYARKHPNEKFIFEGVQNLGRGTEDIPRVFKGTGAFESTKRANKRMAQSGFKRKGLYAPLNASLYPKVKKEKYILDQFNKGFNKAQVEQLLNMKRNAKIGAGGAAIAGAMAMKHLDNKAKETKVKIDDTKAKIKKKRNEES